MAKENTISHHTGVNVTEDVPVETLISNGTGRVLEPTHLIAAYTLYLFTVLCMCGITKW